jgi:glutamate 5-kinase
MAAQIKNLFRQDLPGASTLVVKVGSRILVSKGSAGQQDRVAQLADDIAALRQAGARVVLVSSGAIANGMGTLGLVKRPKTTPAKQACASIGQIKLMNRYTELFGRHNLHVGQVLLTGDDLRDKKRYLNLRNTLFQLLDYGAIPIINENDSVGTEEINFGDNDTLGAQIAMLVNADAYVILTDVDGLFDDNPSKNRNARHIPVIRHITPEIHALASGTKAEISVGGMITKIRAADMVTRSGIYALIGNGFHHRLSDVLRDPVHGSLFIPTQKRMNSRQRWIAFSRKPIGAIVVDKGAQHALAEQGKSLLPAGVNGKTGAFKAGDMVAIQTESGTIIGRGLTNYSSLDLDKIKGCKTGDIERILGEKTFDEVIHRDNMVVL